MKVRGRAEGKWREWKGREWDGEGEKGKTRGQEWEKKGTWEGEGKYQLVFSFTTVRRTNLCC